MCRCIFVLLALSSSIQLILTTPNLGEMFPDFMADTTHGRIRFHADLESSWAILFFHPADYMPVGTAELGRAAILRSEFAKRRVKMAALSCDSVENHREWIKDIVAYAKIGPDLPYYIIADPQRDIAVKLGMLDADDKDTTGMLLPVRGVFIIGPDKRLKISLLYPASTGLNFDEILRMIDSLQLTAISKVATPADWKSGDDFMVLPNMSKEEADKLFPNHKTVDVPSGKDYIRLIPQPRP